LTSLLSKAPLGLSPKFLRPLGLKFGAASQEMKRDKRHRRSGAQVTLFN